MSEGCVRWKTITMKSVIKSSVTASVKPMRTLHNANTSSYLASGIIARTWEFYTPMQKHTKLQNHHPNNLRSRRVHHTLMRRTQHLRLRPLQILSIQTTLSPLLRIQLITSIRSMRRQHGFSSALWTVCGVGSTVRVHVPVRVCGDADGG